jgi:ubiquinone/menaquinone biosynthesis C-methylase UbiE
MHAVEAVDAAEHWDTLHEAPRYRPRFPQDDVVRFLARWFDRDVRNLRALDVGAGAGRHTKLLCEMGFSVTAVDISAEGLRHTRERLAAASLSAELHLAPMTALPLPDGSVDVLVSFGVLNYERREGMALAIREMHRVMRPGGEAFVMLRTCDDYRFGAGEEVEPRTFVLTIADTGERGTVQHFLREQDVPAYFAAFSEVAFEKTEHTFDGRRHKNSDWLIRLKK